jgi:tetratricopeptide (TPR) repeat protein
MVAVTPRYRTQSDPDGVIHVSDDDNPIDYKGAGPVDDVVDVTHLVDPPDVREELAMDRRDPPTDPGSPIYEVTSVVSGTRVLDMVEEHRPSTPGLPRNPSYPANSGPAMSHVSITRSVVKSSSSLAKSHSYIPTDSPVRSVESQLHEIISVESMIDVDNTIMEHATAPISPSQVQSQNWHDRVDASQPRTMRYQGDIHSESAPEAANSSPKARPISVEEAISPPPLDPSGAMGILPLAGNESKYQAAPDRSPQAEDEQDEDADGSAWVFTNIMNTLSCRGPEPMSAAGPFTLVTCGTSHEKYDPAFGNDDEDNSVLGTRGFGDLASLPSLEDSIIHKVGDTDNDNESLSSRVSRVSLQTECLGNAVESKIKNLEMEQQLESGLAKDQSSLKVDPVASDPEVQRLELELREAFKSFGKNHVRCSHVSSVLADKYAEMKAFKKALELNKSVVAVLSTKLGDAHQDTLDAKVRLGKSLEDAEQYDEGISSFYEVMAMRRALAGDKDPSTSDALILIANCLRKKGQYMQAIRELKRALKVYRESLGDSHPCVASTVDEIASLYVTLGDFEKSAAILEEVVKLKAATLGMQNRQVASSLVELATSYECSEDFDRAVKALKKAYKIYTDFGGFSCEEATSTLHRIALIYQASGDIHKAAIAYLGVLRGKKHLLGDDHLEVAETYYRLGVCLRETNQLDKALKCMKEALPILVGKGKNIHDVDMIAEVMHEMALLYKAKRQLTEAAKIFKQELTVRRKIGQPDYPCIAKTLNHLGVTEYEMKMHRRALKHLLEVLTIFQERQEQGIDFAEALYNIGLVFEAVRNKERAYEAFLEAARVFKTNGYANDHPHMQKAVNKVKRLATRK